ncbi:protein Smaug homolog 1 [Nematostella vectensis]|uniref:protein Smaug homolog 1 n=1 Tax=Nematostella vectensis TaxID=45351 RepID=UPI002076FDB2|nr:protein Smaug homolog 1 [Nematostella vectensis]XP_032221816.2 protein Smaug homolog 1 [Nematostella vectensis]XP_032221817.2 protein Smaug homolog 1 [Nematostella vectensis]
MKPAHTHFRDQVSALVGWFSNWNECEQTIALYTLLKRISTTQARFLSLILEHTFRDDPVEIQLLQRQANDKEFLSNLCHETKAVAVQQLLAHLPLLVPGNDEARFEYLQLLPKILTHTVQHSVHQDECMQLLSLALVHPAFPPEERNSLLCWLSHLEKTLGIKERQNSGPARLQTTESSDMPGSCDNLVRHNYTRGRVNGWRNQPLVHHDSGLGSFETQPSYGNYNSGMGSSMSSIMRKSRSGSLTPPPPVEEQDSVMLDDCMGDSLQVEIRPGRSQSFPVDPQRLNHQLSPQSSTESEQDESSFRHKPGSFNAEEARPGMKDVPMWLKSLRLHKYGSLFSQLSYEEMLNLSDEYLESKGVTKGARNKILLSTRKLQERSDTLQKLEKEVLQNGKLQAVLKELQQIVNTPIKPFTPSPGVATSGSVSSSKLAEQSTPNPPPHPEDLPGWITRVMGKACTQILVSRADEEHCTLYLTLLDKTLASEAFTPTQKRRLQSWKQQCQRLVRQQQFARRPSSQEKSRGWYYLSSPPTDPNASLQPPVSPGTVTVKPRHRSSPRCVTNKTPPAVQLRSSSTETPHPGQSKPTLVRSHAIVGRTKSLPVRTTTPQLSLPEQDSTDETEGFDNSLESLCLRMTEQALSDTGDQQ